MSELGISIDSNIRVANSLNDACRGTENTLNHPIRLRNILQNAYKPAEDAPYIFAALLDKYNMITCHLYHNTPFDFCDDVVNENIETLKRMPKTRNCGNVYQLYKLLQCYNYNINIEGYDYDLGDDNEQYLFLKLTLCKVLNKLAEHIVSFTPEYNEAGWDFVKTTK